MIHKGKLQAVLSYLLWGILPIYWKLMKEVPSWEILGHRIIWAFFFAWSILLIKGETGWVKNLFANRKSLKTFIFTSIIIGCNWGIYIWAVNSGYIVEASLGYFICPLMNVVLGVIVLKESLNRTQWLSVCLACIGILYMTVSYGSFPWIALTLAAIFAVYGLVRKTAALEAFPGFTTEMSFLFLPALSYIIYLQLSGTGHFIESGFNISFLLFCAGSASAIPLILFAAAARKVPLTTIGILQYILPTMQFIVGVFIYHEEMSNERLIGFLFIWVSLIIYTSDGIIHRRKKIASRIPPEI